MRLNWKNARRAFLGAAFCLFATGARAADDGPPPPIRHFDIKTIERLGREMFEQDQWAWKATDLVLERRGEAGVASDGIAGWVTGRIGGKPRVRFMRLVNEKPEVLYDVVFDGDAMTFSTPASRALSAEELGQYNARKLALESAGNACSNIYNTVVLKDPEGDGWLVWAMAATQTDADAIIIGGHFRLTISADGKTIKRRDALSKSCIQLSRTAGMSPDTTERAFMVSNVVSPTPIETHVFASLSYGIALYVGTRDGQTWKASGGTLRTVDMDAPEMDGYSARTMAGMDEICRVIAENKDGKFEVVGELQVILATESEEKFSVVVPDGLEARSVVCGRFDIIPAPNDYKVLLAGYPLMISDNGDGHPARMGTLELSDGRFRFRLVEGETLTKELLDRLEKRLDQLQEAIQD